MLPQPRSSREKEKEGINSSRERGRLGRVCIIGFYHHPIPGITEQSGSGWPGGRGYMPSLSLWGPAAQPWVKLRVALV